MSDIFTFIILCTRVVLVKGFNFQAMAPVIINTKHCHCMFPLGLGILLLDIQYSSLYNV